MTNFFFCRLLVVFMVLCMCVIAATYIVIVVGIIVILVFVVLLSVVIGLLVKKFKSRRQNSHDQSTLSAIGEPNLADDQVPVYYDGIPGDAAAVLDPPMYQNICCGQESAAAEGVELKDIDYEQLQYPNTENDGNIYEVMPV